MGLMIVKLMWPMEAENPRRSWATYGKQRSRPIFFATLTRPYLILFSLRRKSHSNPYAPSSEIRLPARVANRIGTEQ